MNAQDLKNSILQLAVQGKLVEQRPEEGTAKELLEQIKAEKEKLIKEKKIKKEKKLIKYVQEIFGKVEIVIESYKMFILNMLKVKVLTWNEVCMLKKLIEKIFLLKNLRK